MIIKNDNDDLPAIERQLKRACMMWGRIVKVLKKKRNSNAKKNVNSYKVIVLTALLYSPESWVIWENGWRKYRSFHNRCARFITGRHITQTDGIWMYPSSKDTREEADLLTV